jgi:hypothetical protein
MAAGYQPRRTASVADQDRIVRILQESFIEGRLGVDEFKQRVGQAIAARDFRELIGGLIPGGGRRALALPSEPWPSPLSRS